MNPFFCSCLSKPSEELQLLVHLASSMTNYVDIDCNLAEITIEHRFGYCDRGSFIVKVHSKNCAEFWVDGSDMFPRYYFIFENLISEMSCWIKKRKLKIKSISGMMLDETGKFQRSQYFKFGNGSLCEFCKNLSFYMSEET